jgi:flagellar protein FliS
MTYDPTATYRSTQVASSSPASRVVLLYQGAVRFGTQHINAIERGDLETAHQASVRCQAIVSSLQETLDLSAGPLAMQLDQLYGFVLRRLVDGNLTKTTRPTQEALTILRDLLGSWQEIARTSVVTGGAEAQARPVTAIGATYGAALS